MQTHSPTTPNEVLVIGAGLAGTEAAWQIFEEKTKGTLEAGKLADLVILSQDPLAVPPDAIKDIAVVETIKEGKTIWEATTSGRGGDQRVDGIDHRVVGMDVHVDAADRKSVV